MKINSFLLIASGLTLAIAACSSSSSTDGDPCSAFLDAYAAYDAKCAPSPYATTSARNVDECHRLLGLSGVSGKEGALRTCAQALNQASATCGAIDATACGVPAGTLSTGTTCVVSSQCASTFCNNFDSSSYPVASLLTEAASCGTCADRLPVGSPCGDVQTNIPCVAGAQCMFGSSSGSTCVAGPGADVGGSCQPPAFCKDGLICQGSSWTCVAPVDVGGACIMTSDCKQNLGCIAGKCAHGVAEGSACSATELCDGGLYCDGASSKCTKVVLVEPGGTCDAYGFEPCRVGYCNIVGTATSGTCPPVIADGQPCSLDGLTNTCDTYAHCDNGTCTRSDSTTCK